MESSTPRFVINKPVAMVDEKINISIKNLNPFEEITVIGRITEHKADYISHGHFIADNTGMVNLSHHASLGGTYLGIDSMGILWSMVTSSEAPKGSRLSNKYGATTPYKVQLAVVKGFQKIRCWNDAVDKVCEAQLERWYLASDTERIPIRHGRIRATLFTPKNGGRRPGIIDLFGSSGGLFEIKAALLASYGYTCLALAYFDYEDLPKGLEFDYDYFDEAIEFMWNHPRIDNSQRLAVMGVSKGSEIALHMSSYNHKIKVCISINGGNHYSFGTHTYKGRKIKTHMHDWSKLVYNEHGLVCHHTHSDLTGQDVDLLPVERANAHFLIIHSDDDQAYDTNNALTLARRIRESGNKNCVLKILPGAGHLLEPPYMPLCSIVFHKFINSHMVYGGEPRMHAVAQEESWNSILQFLRKHFCNDFIRIGRIPTSNL